MFDVYYFQTATNVFFPTLRNLFVFVFVFASKVESSNKNSRNCESKNIILINLNMRDKEFKNLRCINLDFK